MAQEKFKLPRSSYEELCRIIIAYGSLGEPSSLDEVTKRSGIGETIVSSNNAFLTVVGIIEGGKNKIATEKGRALARALEHERTEESKKSWRTIVEDNEFLNKMVLAVRIRKGMEISSLEGHIAYSAGQPKTAYVMTGARTVIDVLLNSGLVKEEDDRIVPEEIVLPEETDSLPRSKLTQPIAKVTSHEGTTPAEVSLQIQVRIDVKPSELEGLGEKI